MIISHFRAVIVTMVLVGLAVILAVLFVHVDMLPALRTYGFSVGTNSHYCSLDLVRSHVAFSCQSAR